MTRQESILAAIGRYWAENDVAPTLREIAEATGVKGVSTVLREVKALRAANPPKVSYLERDGRMLPRTLRLVEQPETTRT